MCIFTRFLSKLMDQNNLRKGAFVLLMAVSLVSCGEAPANLNLNSNMPATSSGSTVQEQPVAATNASACTEDYSPVCAKKQVECIKAPCPPVEETYTNRCFAEQDGATNIESGACQMD